MTSAAVAHRNGPSGSRACGYWRLVEDRDSNGTKKNAATAGVYSAHGSQPCLVRMLLERAPKIGYLSPFACHARSPDRLRGRQHRDAVGSRARDGARAAAAHGNADQRAVLDEERGH